MKKKLLVVLGVALAAAGTLGREYILKAFELWNGWYGSGGEAFITLIGLIAAGVGAYYYVLPDYVAVAFHDGKYWLDYRTFWSARKDFELFGKAEAGILFGRFVKDSEVRIPRISQPKFYRLILFGAERGIYRVMPVRVLPDGMKVLEESHSFPKTEKPRFAFQTVDENLPLK